MKEFYNPEKKNGLSKENLAENLKRVVIDI